VENHIRHKPSDLPSTERRSATDRDYLAPRQPANAPVARQTLAMTIILVATMIGAIALYRLGTDVVTVSWTLAFVLFFGGLGGWMHHPVRRFRSRGAVAGIVTSAGALIATYLYIAWRGGEDKILLGEELAIPFFIGAAPGMYLYRLLLLDEKVEPWEQLPRNDPR